MYLGDSFKAILKEHEIDPIDYWFCAQLVYLDFGPQTGVINKIYNLYHHVLG